MDDDRIIKIGSQVVVEANGARDEIVLVAPGTLGQERGYISAATKVGRALLGHREGDTITVSSSFPVVYKIVEVRNGRK